MNNLLLVICSVAFLCSCTDNEVQTYDEDQNVHISKRKGEENVVGFDKKDTEMKEAIARAQKELPVFIKTLNNPSKNQEMFGVKGRFESKEKDVEYIWVAIVKYQDGKFYGITMNKPLHILGMPKESKVILEKEDIYDWFYYENDKMIGGYTNKVAEQRNK